MDTFRISNAFDKEGFINAYFIRWEIHWRKNRKQLINYFVISLVILLLGILARTEEEPTNPFIFLGIGFLIFSFFLFCVRIISKRNYICKIKKIADEYDFIKMDCTYEFSDESVKYWDKEKKLEFNWSVFTNYSIYKGYLILFLNNSLIESYLFKEEETNIDEYSKLLEIVKSKLEYKEIK